MKIIGSFIGLIFLSFASYSATYSGTGKWKSEGGQSGEYAVNATIEPGSDNTVAVSETITFDNQALELSFVLRKRDDTYFDVLDNQSQIVGSGYCWPLDDDEQFVCHSVSHLENFVVESTIKKTADSIYRIGSKTPIEGGESIIWKDVLLLQSNG